MLRALVALCVAATVRLPGADAQQLSWLRQFGGPRADYVASVSGDATGIYVAGAIAAETPSPTAFGSQTDALICKLDRDAREIWSRHFASAERDYATGVCTDATGVYVVGRAGAALTGKKQLGSTDVFIGKYDTGGSELWTRQFGTSAQDEAAAVAADGTGIYVVGSTAGVLPAQAAAGGFDAFLRKYDPDGNELWTVQFGTAGSDTASAVTCAADGVYVAGHTSGALPGQSNAGQSDCFLRKYDAQGRELWTRQWGTWADDDVRGIAADGDSVYLIGTSWWWEAAGRGLTYERSGGRVVCLDSFLRSHSADGAELWAKHYEPPEAGGFTAVSVGPGGVYVAGAYLAEGLEKGDKLANSDVFVSHYAAEGQLAWTERFGSSDFDAAHAVYADARAVYVAGDTWGVLPGQAEGGGGKAFLARLSLGDRP